MAFESHLARHQVAARSLRRVSDKCHCIQLIALRGRTGTSSQASRALAASLAESCAVTTLFIDAKKADGSAKQHRPCQYVPHLAGFGYDEARELRRTALMFELAPELLILTIWD